MWWANLTNEIQNIWSALKGYLPDGNSMLVIFNGLLALFTWRVWRDGRVLQRAYVAVEPRGIHLMLNGSDLIGLIGMNNAGNLPARKVSWSINIMQSVNGDEPAKTFEELGAGKGNIVIAPRTVTTRGSRANVGLETALEKCNANTDRSLERDLYMFVWGFVRYDDGFKNIRTTKFCHRYPWKMRGKGGGTEQYDVAPEFGRLHEHGNDAD